MVAQRPSLSATLALQLETLPDLLFALPYNSLSSVLKRCQCLEVALHRLLDSCQAQVDSHHVDIHLAKAPRLDS